MPETGETVIDLPAQPIGTLRFACGMGMYRGQIEFVVASAIPPAQQQPAAGTPVAASPANPSAASAQTADCDPSVTSCLPPNTARGQAGLAAVGKFIGPIAPAQANADTQATVRTDIQTINIQVTDSGYQPAVTRAKANLPSKLVLQTQDVYG